MIFATKTISLFFFALATTSASVQGNENEVPGGGRRGLRGSLAESSDFEERNLSPQSPCTSSSQCSGNRICDKIIPGLPTGFCRTCANKTGQFQVVVNVTRNLGLGIQVQVPKVVTKGCSWVANDTSGRCGLTLLTSNTKAKDVCPVTCSRCPVTESPSEVPTESPSDSPTESPSNSPSNSPTESPSNSPSNSPTESPSDYPTAAPTISHSESPTGAPSGAPVCPEQEQLHVCVAVDNSASVCMSSDKPMPCTNPVQRVDNCQAGGAAGNSDLLCGNYEQLTVFAGEYIDRMPSGTSFSVVNYATIADVITSNESATAAKNAISTTEYTGGFTNTQHAIEKCTEALDDSCATEKVIVLITDGNPTACNDDKGRTYNTFTNYGINTFSGDSLQCTEEVCPFCKGTDVTNPQSAAEYTADVAANLGMSVVPVVVNTEEDTVNQLRDLARCPSGSNACDVDAFDVLYTTSIDGLFENEILENLVLFTAGNEEIQI